MMPPPVLDLPNWREQSLQQLKRLNEDRVPRILSVSLGLVMAAFFITPVATALIVVSYLISEATVPWLMRGYETKQTKRQMYIHLLLSLIGTTAYSANLILLWNSGDPALGMVAVAFLCGGFVNIATVNTHYLPMAATKAVPLLAATIYIPATILRQEGFRREDLFLIGATLLLIGYVGQMILGMHRTENELNAAHRKLAETSHAKSQFLATMSHGMRTPLNAILGATRLIAAHCNENVSRELRDLERAALSLSATIDDALFAAEEGGADQALHPTLAHLRNSLEIVAAQIQEAARESSVKLIVSIDPDLPDVATYSPPMLSRLVRGLVDSAMTQFNSADQILTVTATRLDGPADGEGAVQAAMALRVQSNGKALDAEKILVALAPVIRKMGGRSYAEVSPGAAAVPVFVVPLGLVPSASAKEPLSGKARALVVDDIATNRFIAVQLLKSEQVVVAEAASGEEALRALDRGDFEVVLLDMNMPGMTGQQTLAAIRSSGRPWANVPVIALTASALGAQKRDYQSMGLSGFVQKPIDRAVMMAEINRVLGFNPKNSIAS